MQLLECQITQKCIELATSLLPKNVSIDFHLIDATRWRIEKTTKYGLTEIKTIVLEEEQSNDCQSDLILKCHSQTFFSIIQGSKNPIRAFLEEEIEMFGDIGLALTLYSFLPELNNMETINAK